MLQYDKNTIKLTLKGIWQRPYNLGELAAMGQSETDYHYTLSFDQTERALIYEDSRGVKRAELADGQYFYSLENVAKLITVWDIVNNGVNSYRLTEQVAALLLAWYYIDKYYTDGRQIANWYDQQLTTYGDGKNAVHYALQALVNERLDGEAGTDGYKGDGDWYPGGLINLYFVYWDCERIDDPFKLTHPNAVKKEG